MNCCNPRTRCVGFAASLLRTEEERDIKKWRKVPCQRARVKYRFINDHRHVHHVATLDRVLHVSRGGFYQWIHKPLSDKALEDQRLLELIRDSYRASSGVNGVRRVLGDLREAGEVCSKHRFANIMHTQKIKAIRGYKALRSIAARSSMRV